MCPPIVGVILTIVGSLGTAFVQAGIARQQAKIEQRQLAVEIENERIKGMGEANDRLAAFRADEAANRAALSATGVDVNYSYVQGIAPANRRVVARDIARLQFNTGQEVGRKKYEIAVAGWRSRTTTMSAFTQAGADIAGAAATQIGSRSGVTANAVYGQ